MKLYIFSYLHKGKDIIDHFTSTDDFELSDYEGEAMYEFDYNDVWIEDKVKSQVANQDIFRSHVKDCGMNATLIELAYEVINDVYLYAKEEIKQMVELAIKEEVVGDIISDHITAVKLKEAIPTDGYCKTCPDSKLNKSENHLICPKCRVSFKLPEIEI